ncbi:toxin VasX [Photobacterium sp. 1_MG-2023]|uniref:toxin VasX n=1 Tax=Photobacterium sp. 1_MG-2023 TaxID=3062646 RepID=UPI0026E2148D|nr:toxin VasX [Photobacterium sp. 1_MG-2023]MDO6706674.1 hypothetical protein [Photobacterium sp. 1_MG-2023]
MRYALDENDDAGEPKHGLPDAWRGRGYFSHRSTDPYHYTLRQMRDGWLYVYNETDKTLDEYEFKGVTLTQYVLENYDYKTLDPVQRPTERGTPGISQPFLTYQSDASIRLVWSKTRWSWPMFYRFATNPDARFFARHIDVSRVAVYPGDHIGSLDLLEQVSDIDPQGGEIERFSGLMSTKMPEEKSFVFEDPDLPEKIEVTLELEIKPVASSSEITESIPADEAAYLVAINDLFSDLGEMGVRFTAIVTEWQDWLEGQALHNQVLEAAMQLTATGIPKGMDIPHPTLLEELPRSEQLTVYQEICALYEQRRMYEAATELGGNNTVTRAEGLWVELQRMEEAFRKKHGSIDYRQFYKDWFNLRKNRRMVDPEQLVKDKITYYEQEDFRFPWVEKHRDATLAMLRQFGKDVTEKGFVDIFSLSGQMVMQSLHQSLATPLLFSRLTQPQSEWLGSEYDNPTG